MQMKLQRQHFLLCYFKTLGDVQAGVKLKTAWQPEAQPTEPQVLEWGEIFCFPKGDPVSHLNDLLSNYSELFTERYEGP